MRQVPRVRAFGDMNSELFGVQEHVPWEKGRHAREHEAGRPQRLVANDDLSYPTLFQWRYRYVCIGFVHV
jgi:hypothetical protein